MVNPVGQSEGSTLGILRYQKKLQKLKESQLESCSSAGYRTLVHAVSVCTDSVKSWVHNAKKIAGKLHSVVPLIEDLDPAVVSLISCRTILDGISTHRTINSLAMAVGRSLEDEVKFQHLRRHHPRWWRRHLKLALRIPVEGKRAQSLKKAARKDNHSVPSWTPKQRCAAGLVCIELFRQSVGIIEIVTTKHLTKSQTTVRATDEFLAWLEKSHAASEILRPVFLPMVSRPLPWSSVDTGGYPEHPRTLVKTRNKTYLEIIDRMDMSLVYSSINAVQSTPFIVSPKVLCVLQHCWEHDLCIGDLPKREPIPVPERPEGADKETRRTWWKNACRIKYDNECERSKKIAVSKTLWLAKKYLNKTIYFPHELDFRGRMYPTTNFLNVQGPDYARALLRFRREQKVTDEGKSWLAIHGANCWGYDKVPMSERLKVISDNHALIMEIGNDPLSTMDWTKADKPFGFLAFCIEWHAIHTGSETTGLPVHMDGSNNGLQIFSLLLRDPVGGLATNCLPTDTPRDIYADVADRLLDKLNVSTDPLAKRWLGLGIDRKATKRVVMCMPYGLTKFSSHEYVRDWYIEKSHAQSTRSFDVDEVFPAIKFLTGLLWESIDEVVSAARECMDWLKEVARICVEHGVPIRWTAPNGLLVQQDYRKTERIAVKTSIGSVVRQHRIVQDKTDLSLSRNVNGISPNFVHSLDASVLMGAVNIARHNGVDSFSCIHDSVGVNAEHAGIMASAIRESAIDIFEKPVLEIVKSEIEKYLPVPLPDPPARGSMDITALRDADYFFA